MHKVRTTLCAGRKNMTSSMHSSKSTLDKLSVGLDVGTVRSVQSTQQVTTNHLWRPSTSLSVPQKMQHPIPTLQQLAANPSSDELLKLLRKGLSSPLVANLHSSHSARISEYRKNFSTGHEVLNTTQVFMSGSSHRGKEAGLTSTPKPERTAINTLSHATPMTAVITTPSSALVADGKLGQTATSATPATPTIEARTSFSRQGGPPAGLRPSTGLRPTPSLASWQSHRVSSSKSTMDQQPTLLQRDTKPAVGPHKASPYKPGSLLSPEFLTSNSQYRHPSSSSRSGSRPSTADPITHTLSGPQICHASSILKQATQFKEYQGVQKPLSRGQPMQGSNAHVQTIGTNIDGGIARPSSASATGLSPIAPISGRPRLQAMLADSSALVQKCKTSSAQAQSHSHQLQQESIFIKDSQSRVEADGKECNEGHLEDVPTSVSHHQASKPAAVVTPSSQSSALTPYASSSGLDDYKDVQPEAMHLSAVRVGADSTSGSRPSSVSSRPCSATSNYSMQNHAVGHTGRHMHAGTLQTSGRTWRKDAGALGTVYEEEDVDSVDLAILRIRRDHSKDDEAVSIDIVNDVVSEGPPSSQAHVLKTVEADTLPGRKVPQTYVRHQKIGHVYKEGPLASSFKLTGRGGEGGANSQKPSRFKTSSVLQQAAPMVLNLEDLTCSTPEVLEQELGRMSLDELLQLDSKVSIAAATNDRGRMRSSANSGRMRSSTNSGRMRTSTKVTD
ncbi:hypothetical protein CEUSTIGMA_g12404.t1 [Chlamydomonas eustigma]|uniref:Uncharacterized protein n=1 Tax=Chlamydomonas eustigma TaxID=1157962 RepID=A0A250XPQ0_9CHLO|nr:hypothetical protein CEUSTIGMA_g12404.t1 [Chlamydomonas eustigma]|eukprot:GAX84983.1 hypothetical protein CEUSTIGMA_g12404.t1 [Chlamydomonas eustigma]